MRPTYFPTAGRLSEGRHDPAGRFLVENAHHVMATGRVGCYAANVKLRLCLLEPCLRLRGPECRQLQGDHVEFGLLGGNGGLGDGRVHFLFINFLQNYTSGCQGHHCSGDSQESSQESDTTRSCMNERYLLTVLLPTPIKGHWRCPALNNPKINPVTCACHTKTPNSSLQR